MTRFGVLGAGRIGQVHARAIAATPGAVMTAIADPLEAAAQAAVDAYGGEIRTLDAIIDAGDVDAVVICTPTDTHADLIERAARAGKAIFCEKPIDLDLARVRACLGVVEETGATLMLGFNRRYDPDFMALKAIVDGGRIGPVETVTITSRDPGPPPGEYITRSGGMFRDMTIHDFDIARWMLGEEPESVLAVASNLVDPEIGALGDIDTATVILRTATGKQTVIQNSRRAAYGYDQRIEVAGALGAASAQNQHTARIEVATAEGFQRPPLQDFFMTRYAEAYAAEIAEFTTALAAGRPPRTGGHDGLMALALADAAVRSVAEGRAVAMAEIMG
ncbi:inositol 2-dehydrogenase [Jannaschia pagri]|uniref:Inositol 2-dehydrogenase n=1 Tax=Jannaschia pagri TaxID=2829797 RepID=A0ABQ4NNJ5_9RHOB|nr:MULTISPECIES: inositol 2-dehydrogenase [unclassified Jannaschia]GIT92001.1 inositol 2-dehydrogenase [Jannaschia sp. AI_61]GIT95835.1 inositol 2-dehydrogenase [Jannaschia sp. AI_62]